MTVNGVNHTITPAQNTLQGLVNAINADSSTGVSASIVNVGGSGSPDYRLSVQSNALDAVTVQLNDGTNDLLNTICNRKSGHVQDRRPADCDIEHFEHCNVVTRRHRQPAERQHRESDDHQRRSVD